MTRDEIEQALRDVAGDPTSGPVADIIPAFADALAQAMVPTPTSDDVDTRVVKASEKR